MAEYQGYPMTHRMGNIVHVNVLRSLLEVISNWELIRNLFLDGDKLPSSLFCIAYKFNICQADMIIQANSTFSFA